MVTPRGYIPERGDLVWITMNPRVGHEQAGRRPAVILSPLAYNGKVGLAIMCPLTTHAKGYPFEVAVPPGLPLSGAILSDQAKNLDWRERKAAFVCQLPRGVVLQVMSRLHTLLVSRET